MVPPIAGWVVKENSCRMDNMTWDCPESCFFCKQMEIKWIRNLEAANVHFTVYDLEAMAHVFQWFTVYRFVFFHMLISIATLNYKALSSICWQQETFPKLMLDSYMNISCVCLVK